MSAFKIIKSGHVVEIYQYQKWFGDLEKEKFEGRSGGRKKEEDKKEVNEERKEEYKMTVNHRARNKLRRLITANFDEGDLFITLTFAENMTDIEQANYEFKKFIQKLQRRQKKTTDIPFKYVAVIEFQKRGAIHYHMICNYDLTWGSSQDLQEKERKLAKVWGHGFVDIKDISHVDNTGAYLIKYMSKDQIDERLEGKKRYFFSRTCEQPQEIEGENVRAYIETFLEGGMIPTFTNSYDTDFFGRVQYKEFNVKRGLN